MINIIVMTDSSGRYERMPRLLAGGLMGNDRSVMVQAEKQSPQEIIYMYIYEIYMT